MHKQNGWITPFKVCRESIRKWKGDARIVAIVCLVCLFAWIRIEELRTVCESYKLSISCWYFPFQISDIHTLFYYFGLLLLFCDAPFVDNQQLDVLLRVGKKNWFLGKILYIITASCLYFLLIFVVGVLEFFPNVGFSLQWEDMMNILSLDSLYSTVIRRNIIINYSPIEACFIQYMICVLVGILLGLIVFYFNLSKNKNMGMAIALTMVLMGAMLSLVDLGATRFIIYFIPIAWTDIDIFHQTFGGVSLAYAVTVLGIGIMVLSVLIMRKSKQYNIECQAEV